MARREKQKEEEAEEEEEEDRGCLIPFSFFSFFFFFFSFSIYSPFLASMLQFLVFLMFYIILHRRMQHSFVCSIIIGHIIEIHKSRHSQMILFVLQNIFISKLKVYPYPRTEHCYYFLGTR